jgi:hypothetical protein
MKQAKIYLFFLKYLSISVFSVKIWSLVLMQHLKNKKASGLDCISNEMIEASSSVLPNLYVDIFSLFVLDK